MHTFAVADFVCVCVVVGPLILLRGCYIQFVSHLSHTLAFVAHTNCLRIPFLFISNLFESGKKENARISRLYLNDSSYFYN